MMKTAVQRLFNSRLTRHTSFYMLGSLAAVYSAVAMLPIGFCQRGPLALEDLATHTINMINKYVLP